MVTFDGEDFEDIKGYEGRYAVSRSGRVYSYPNRSHKKGKILVVGNNKNYGLGYNTVGLLKDGVYVKKFVHRLVAETFIPTDLSYKIEVNHIDGDRINNSVENLEWVSHKENMEHALDIGLIERAIPRIRTHFVDISRENKFAVKKLSVEDIDRVKKLYSEIPSLRKLAKMFSVSHETIRQALLQKGSNVGI